MDLHTIEEPSSWSGVFGRRLRRLFDQAADMLADKVGQDVPVDTAFYLSAKRGPNGPVLDSVVDDAFALIKEPKLIEAWRTLNATTKSCVVSDIEYGEKLFSSLPNPPSLGPHNIRSVRRESVLNK